MVRKTDNLRVLFLGMPGGTSTIVLEALLAAGCDVVGVVLGTNDGAGGAPIAPLPPPRVASLLPIANPFAERTSAHVAWERGLPAFALYRPGASEAIAALAALRPDAACVACFPRRIPAELLAVPPRGFLNYHPSLLPAHRGPEPLFWTFRAGESRAGVTIHFMDEGFDTGDVAAQAQLDLPDGISGAATERMCATLGGKLVVAALRDLAAGTLARQPQAPGGSREPSPGAGDFRVDAGWTARRAFNFMRGTAEWGQPYMVAAGGAELALVEAIAYDDGAALEQPYAISGDEVWVRLAQGVLRARLAR